MVRGMELFRGFFQDFHDHFTLIGGTACDLHLKDLGGFRATKDIDILVLLERMNREFATRFHQFLVNGRYQCYVSHDGKRHFYRFIKPADTNYPSQIELLSRTLFPRQPGVIFSPLAADDYIRSMSAIVLGDAYYHYATAHRVVLDGLPCLDQEALIVFKTAAYLNLRQQQVERPKSVRGYDLKKHRNDVFRLLATLSPDSRPVVPDDILATLRDFISSFPDDSPEWPAIIQALGLPGLSAENLRRAFIATFALPPTS